MSGSEPLSTWPTTASAFSQDELYILVIAACTLLVKEQKKGSAIGHGRFEMALQWGGSIQ
jgi:hypothetical protein